jgi:hypothetical protein
VRGHAGRGGGALRSAGAVALAIGALALAAPPATAVDEPIDRAVPPSVIDALRPGGSVDATVRTLGATELAGRAVTYGSPLLYVKLDVQQLAREPATLDGPFQVSELWDPSLTDPANTDGPYLWLVPLLAAGGPYGYALLQESGAVGSLVDGGADLGSLVHTITDLPPVRYLVATQLGGLWAVQDAGDATPVDRAAQHFLAARFPGSAPRAGLDPDELRIALREAAFTARPARVLDRRLAERVLGVALACAGGATLAIVLSRRRRPGDPDEPDAR